jgi:aspartyl protease family protein
MLKAVFAFAILMLVLAYAAPELAPQLVSRFAPEAAPKPDAQSATRGPGGDQVVLNADRSGHYFTQVTINGLSLRGVVDTGASLVSLTYEDGRRLGLIVPGDTFDMRTQTANGEARAKRVRLNSLRLGSIELRDVDASIAGEGQLGVNLLGMSFLNRLDRFEVRDRRLVLEE